MAWRLARQGLTAREPAGRMLELVSRICGLHAQLLSSAELSLWARLEGVTSQTVSGALWEDRTLVKTWAMRGTLHLLPASEYWTWQAALSTYDHYLKPPWFKYFEVSKERLEALIEAVAEALHGEVLTREELAQSVADRTGSPELGEKMRESWGALLKPASFQGKLCFGPGSGQKVRFTHPESWLGRRSGADPAGAVSEITRRFLGSNGPATRDDYARWWAVSPAQALARIRKLGEEVTEVDVEGSRCWMLSDHVAEAASARALGKVNLVPAFDQYVIAATRHADNMMPGPFRSRVYRPQGWISPVLLVDGRMDGVWSHERKGNRLAVTVQPFTPLPAAAKEAAEQEASKLTGFLNSDRLELRFT